MSVGIHVHANLIIHMVSSCHMTDNGPGAYGGSCGLCVDGEANSSGSVHGLALGHNAESDSVRGRGHVAGVSRERLDTVVCALSIHNLFTDYDPDMIEMSGGVVSCLGEMIMMASIFCLRNSEV